MRSPPRALELSISRTISRFQVIECHPAHHPPQQGAEGARDGLTRICGSMSGWRLADVSRHGEARIRQTSKSSAATGKVSPDYPSRRITPAPSARITVLVYRHSSSAVGTPSVLIARSSITFANTSDQRLGLQQPPIVAASPLAQPSTRPSAMCRQLAAPAAASSSAACARDRPAPIAQPVRGRWREEAGITPADHAGTARPALTAFGVDSQPGQKRPKYKPPRHPRQRAQLLPEHRHRPSVRSRSSHHIGQQQRRDGNTIEPRCRDLAHRAAPDSSPHSAKSRLGIAKTRCPSPC